MCQATRDATGGVAGSGGDKGVTPPVTAGVGEDGGKGTMFRDWAAETDTHCRRGSSLAHGVGGQGAV